jgi:hypothetical protein
VTEEDQEEAGEMIEAVTLFKIGQMRTGYRRNHTVMKQFYEDSEKIRQTVERGF